MTRAPLLASLLLLLGLGACSEGSGPAPQAGSGSDNTAQRAAIREDLAAHFAGDHPGTRKRRQADCFAERLTESTGVEQLREAGVLDADYDVVPELPELPEEVARAWAAAQLGCTDLVAESTRAQVDISKGRVDADAYAACLRAALSEDELEAAVVDTLTGDWGGVDLARLGRAQTECADRAGPS